MFYLQNLGANVDKNEMQRKVKEELDFVKAPKFQNSLTKYLAKTDKIPENGAIGRLLMITSDEVEVLYQESIVSLRKEMLEDGKD